MRLFVEATLAILFFVFFIILMSPLVLICLILMIPASIVISIFAVAGVIVEVVKDCLNNKEKKDATSNQVVGE